MSKSISSIKSDVKSALRGKWIIAIVSAMTILFSHLIIQNIAWVLSIALGDFFASALMIMSNVIFIGPIILGVIRHYWRMLGGLEESPATAFYYFSSFAYYKKAIRLCFKLVFRVLIASIVFNFPALVVSVISNPRFYEMFRLPIPMWSQNLAIVVELLSTVGTVITVFFAIRFYLAPVLVIVNEEIDVDEAIHMSSVISKGSTSDLIFLSLSVLHWIILSLIFYIPLIFTLPYLLMCYVVHFLGAITTYNEKIKKLNDEYFPSFVAGA